MIPFTGGLMCTLFSWVWLSDLAFQTKTYIIIHFSNKYPAFSDSYLLLGYSTMSKQIEIIYIYLKILFLQLCLSVDVWSKTVCFRLPKLFSSTIAALKIYLQGMVWMFWWVISVELLLISILSDVEIAQNVISLKFQAELLQGNQSNS